MRWTRCNSPLYVIYHKNIKISRCFYRKARVMTIYFWKEGKPGPVSRGFKKTALHRKARRSVSAASLRTLEALWVAIRYFYCLNRSQYYSTQTVDSIMAEREGFEPSIEFPLY